jgi:voltage-gated potassium channel
MPLNYRESGENTGWKLRLHEIIYEADTTSGKRFDVLLLWLIIGSVGVVMLESVASINDRFGDVLIAIEWVLTIFFTFEYIARIVTVKKPLKYMFSFFGIIDLLSILPSYLGLFIGSGSSSLRTLRILRLMRVFRVLKLIGFLQASKSKILVFLMAVLMVVTITGTLMYIIEDESAGFDSIPRSIYWAIVTLTTVGYGDISPQSELGQFLASMIMLIGYAIIAVPTGIVSSEMAVQARKDKKEESGVQEGVGKEGSSNTQSCQNCNFIFHDDDADFCKKCGEHLHVRR